MSVTETDVLIVGAGLSGIAAAHHLQTRCPNKSYAIIEARDAIGGTWDLFRYPGIRSDSDMYTFGFAFRPWTDGKVFADGPSIRHYVEDTAQKAGIDQHIRFGLRMIKAEWDSETARWTITARRGETGGSETFVCRFLMNCTGYYRYDQGHMPDFPGLEDFKGDVVHPQLWDEDYDYSGKRVVIIGSGATAVTLVPAMADKAAGVTMLQRSPTYMAARPAVDKFANFLNKILPDRIAYSLIRARNVLMGMFFYWLAQTRPEMVKRMVRKGLRQELGEDFQLDPHFEPNYNPWDQRFCLAPDGDFFQSLKNGSARIVTDHIETFTETRIRLKSGEHLTADLVIPATGLQMLLAGGAQFVVDGEAYTPNENYTYRGMMLSGLPNMALAFGYTNASWTLKVDLTCERVCRLLNHMDKTGADFCTPTPPSDIEPLPLLSFSSGYVQRALPELPKQGSKPPWRTYQNYVQDMMTIRFGRIEDGHLKFAKAKPAEARPLPAPESAAEAAE
jgi:cation diffusion facilitator CzcD-associated flavoprotein CzcO